MAESTRGRGVTALAGLLPRITGKAMRQRGFVESAIVTRWPEIVGADLARDTIPDRLRFPRGRRDGGVLHLRVSGAAALEIQHEEPRIVERVNSFFGYPAIARLALVQAPLPPRETRAPRPVPAPLSPEQEAALAETLTGIGDDRLRDALGRLGRTIRGLRGGR
jgi:hypothetical protein